MTIKLPTPFPNFDFSWVNLTSGKFVKNAYDYLRNLDAAVRGLIGLSNLQSTPVAFADLPDPTVSQGQTIFVTDGRKASEGSGAGTGNMAFSDGTNWIAVDSGAPIAA